MDENLELYLMYDAVYGDDTFEVFSKKEENNNNDLLEEYVRNVEKVNNDLQNLFESFGKLGEINE